MKLSFSIPSKSSSKPNPIKTFNDSSIDSSTPSKTLITQFDPSKPPINPDAKVTVIAPIQDQWRRPRMVNLELPITDPNSDAQSLQFESETLSTEPASDISYGLTLRAPAKRDGGGAEDANDDDRVRRRDPVENVLLQKFKDDLKSLPEDQGFEEFKDVPVEGFGAALLAGYGWTEGMGIGKNAKEDVKIVQFDRRAGKEGLGFVSVDRSSVSKKKDERDDRNKRKNESGRDRDVVDASNEKLGSGEEERYSRKSKESRIRGDDNDKGLRKKHGRDHGKVEEMRVDVNGRKKRDRDRGEVEEMRVEVNGERRKEKRVKNQVSWLTSHIRVRVISKDLKRGRLYLKKGKVLDVVGPTTCDISMDESKEIIQGVSQDFLETAIPRRGGPVLVLYGKHKGAYGSLVERDVDREIGVVKDADTHEFLNVKLEQIAEYTGDPSLLGY
ncbi:hypothetical protein TanjilG_02224 [Lupinus angustifolius]|uniref:G-patch domain-containing protein n=1 Tax=Lupinus angustifolius TaxID=3871 RepID=A0A4P1QQD6_LUPAN|nr:PREDICTED: protein MOS2-like [Lupinus angustifolius]OIV92461.1 hypothetical protein TanjilG_02224 [Lupinus angustifolius]